MQSVDLKILEDEVRSKLQSICRGNAKFTSQKLRAGDFRKTPCYIHALPRLMRANPYLPTADGLAHMLTASDIGPAARLQAAAEHFILLPEVVRTETFLLTHVYLPQDRVLAIYLYPARFNLPEEFLSPERLHRTGGTIRREGLMMAVLKSASDIGASGVAGASNSSNGIMHKYVLRGAEAMPEELLEMEEINRIYTHSFGYSYDFV